MIMDLEYETNEFVLVRKKLVNMISKGELDDLCSTEEEVFMFRRMYKLRGPDCPYLTALCKAIKAMRPELYEQLQQL